MKIYILAVVVSIILSIVLGFITIPILKKIKAKQNILKYVEAHKSKSGTPTMGGIFFVLSGIITFFIFSYSNLQLSIMAIAVTLGFLIVGFLDDFIKIKFSRNLGLTAFQKIMFLLLVSLIASIFAYKSGLTFVFVPFLNKKLYLGVFSIILNVFVFIATVNGTNLTDGLDGLCAVVSATAFIVFGVVILLELNHSKELYVISTEYKNLALLSLCFAGSLLGYLVFNTNKASVFMGDTGSLAIGGAISSIAMFSGNTLFIPFVCITFVASIVSVIIQVVYYKKTKKRVFLMAPIHHHYELKGKSEAKICYFYFLLTLVISLIIIVFMLR